MDLTAPPRATGLYEPAHEHDSCGIALVAKLWGETSHAVVEKALTALANMEHRGAEAADPLTGDGAGILLQIPDAFLRGVLSGVTLPPRGSYGVAVCYLPREAERRAELERLIEETVLAEGQAPLWWRDVPVDERQIGRAGAAVRPVHPPAVIAAAEEIPRAGARAQAVRDPPRDRARRRRQTSPSPAAPHGRSSTRAC